LKKKRHHSLCLLPELESKN